MKISILEARNHVEVVLNFLELFVEANHQLTIIASSHILSQCEPTGLKESNVDLIDIHNWNGQIDKSQCDLLIITTYFNQLKKILTQIDQAVVKLMVVHNANSLFLPAAYGLNFFDFKFSKRLKFLGRTLLFRNVILRKIDHFTFSSRSVYAYSRSYFTNYSSRLLPPLYYNYYRPGKAQDLKPEIRIAVPGTIRNDLRDYKMLFQGISAFIRNTSQPIELYFIGYGNSKTAVKIIKKFEGLVQSNFKVYSNGPELRFSEYNMIMREMDLAILPLKTRGNVNGVNEIQGLTTWAGTLNDIIRYKIPSIIQGSFPLENGMVDYCVRYSNSKQLSSQISNCIDQMDQLNLEKDQLDFEMKKMIDHNERILQSVVT